MEIREIPLELLKVAQEELNEVPEKTMIHLETIRGWIRENSHMKVRSDAQFLLAFLRGCKFNLDKVKQKLELFYSVRQKSPEIMLGRDINNERVIGMIRQGFGLPLPLLESLSAPRLILVRPGIFNPKLYTIQDAMKITTMILDINLNEDDNFVVAGQVCILDLTGVSIKHFTQYNPMFVKKMMTITQDACPGRLKGLHWINCPKGFETVFNLFTVFMNEKNRSRVFVHNCLESLYKHFPRRLLPEEYGGQAGSLESIINIWEKKITSYQNYYQQDALFGIDEKTKAFHQKTSTTARTSVESFRKLEFD